MADLCSEQVACWYDNTTPIVGPRPNSVVPADYEHIRNLLRTLNPSYIVTCGVYAADALAMIRKQAVATANHMQGEERWLLRPWLRLPHPVARNMGVTNQLFEDAGRLLAKGFTGFVPMLGEGEDDNAPEPDPAFASAKAGDRV